MEQNMQTAKNSKTPAHILPVMDEGSDSMETAPGGYRRCTGTAEHPG